MEDVFLPFYQGTERAFPGHPPSLVCLYQSQGTPNQHLKIMRNEDFTGSPADYETVV